MTKVRFVKHEWSRDWRGGAVGVAYVSMVVGFVWMRDNRIVGLRPRQWDMDGCVSLGVRGRWIVSRVSGR